MTELTHQKRTIEEKAKAHMAFEAYLVDLGLRQTKQRRAILDAVLVLGPHVDAETIALQARKIDTSIGLATVYRTLQLMTDAGLLVERQFGKERTQFEFADEEHEHHDHLICNRCGVIVEFYDEALEVMQDRIAAQLGFRLTRHRMEMFADCLKGEACDRNGQAKAKKRTRTP